MSFVTDRLFLIKGFELVVEFTSVLIGERNVTELVVVFPFVITDEWSVTDSQFIPFDWILQTRGKRKLKFPGERTFVVEFTESCPGHVISIFILSNSWKLMISMSVSLEKMEDALIEF